MPAIFRCLECDIETIRGVGGNRKNMFCSIRCNQDYKLKERTKINPTWASACTYMDRFFEYKCAEIDCGITEWKGKPITLQRDHIDGNNKNHNLNNLRWLCANCHTQPSTWGTRNVSPDGKDRIKRASKLGLDVRYGRVPKGTKID